MPAIKYIAYIDEIQEDHVRCSGSFANAHGKGVHSLVRPQVLLGEVQWKDLPLLGDAIVFYEDGTREHRAKNV
jgi:hypothetical protein